MKVVVVVDEDEDVEVQLEGKCLMLEFKIQIDTHKSTRQTTERIVSSCTTLSATQPQKAE